MAKIAIIYGSTTGNTESAATQIAEALSSHEVETMDVSSLSAATLEQYSNLIIGASTWGCGDLQDDWDAELSTLKGADLSGKKVAIFGCGDSGSYPDSFVDGIGTLYEAATAAGAEIIGKVPASDYSYSSSIAEVEGEFVGLPLDDDSMDKNDDRIASWVESISPLFE
ncbi:MAG: flavodoxin FldA [Rikenellaceae bacterium]